MNSRCLPPPSFATLDTHKPRVDLRATEREQMRRRIGRGECCALRHETRLLFGGRRLRIAAGIREVSERKFDDDGPMTPNVLLWNGGSAWDTVPLHTLAGRPPVTTDSAGRIVLELYVYADSGLAKGTLLDSVWGILDGDTLDVRRKADAVNREVFA